MHSDCSNIVFQLLQLCKLVEKYDEKWTVQCKSAITIYYVCIVYDQFVGLHDAYENVEALEVHIGMQVADHSNHKQPGYMHAQRSQICRPNYFITNVKVIKYLTNYQVTKCILFKSWTAWHSPMFKWISMHACMVLCGVIHFFFHLQMYIMLWTLTSLCNDDSIHVAA